MTSGPRGVAIIGAGYAARQHFDAYSRCADIDVVSVCDQDIRAANAFAQLHVRSAPTSVLATTDLATAICRDDVDFVVVCTPPGPRASIALAAMDAAKPVLLEKPPCNSSAQLSELIARSTQRAVWAAVMFQHRLRIPRAALEREWSPDAVAIAEVVRHRPKAPRRSGAWREDPDLALGGSLAHLGSHWIDIVCQLFGHPVAVRGAVRPRIDTQAAIAIEFESGQMMTLLTSSSVGAESQRLSVYDVGASFMVEAGVTRWTLNGQSNEAVHSAADLRRMVYSELSRSWDENTQPTVPWLQDCAGVMAILDRVYGDSREGD